MIQFPEALADAYVSPSRNVALPSMPGRQVRFLQGHAVIKDGRDMVAMMRRSGVKIILTPYAMSWVEVWLKEAGDGVRAEIMIPEDAPSSMWAPELRSTHGTDGADADTGTV
jgi:hypothetical protein